MQPQRPNPLLIVILDHGHPYHLDIGPLRPESNGPSADAVRALPKHLQGLQPESQTQPQGFLPDVGE